MFEKTRARSKSESVYIFKRKIKAFVESICFFICRIFPIDRKLVSVCTFEGRGGFGCNPKYIVEELHKRRPDIKIVWFVNDNKKKFPSYIKSVPNTTWGRAYWLSRSAAWIDNYRKPYGTVKRKKQLYINTWHANMGFKNIGLWRGNAFSLMAYIVSENDSKMIDYVIVDSTYCEKMFVKGLLYDRKYLKVGQPRCDVLYGDRNERKRNYRKKLGIEEDAKIVMYAPTFRETSNNGKRSVFSEEWTIDFEKLIGILKKRFGGKWYLCVRVHPQLADAVDSYHNDALEGRIINASKEDDMYEILAAMDAYVTDYSSAAFDAGNCHMPVFLYADDIEKYSNDRGELLWELSNDGKEIHNNKNIDPSDDMVLPFSIASTNEELCNNILNFNEDEYIRKLINMEKAVDLHFNGNASEKVVEKLIEYIEDNKK